MIPFKEALDTVLDSARVMDTESVSLNDSAGRITAEDILSDMDMPPFDKSAMDGYAYSSKDSADEYRVVEVIQAGVLPEKAIQSGECSKIMTGAAIPEGADRVVKVENIEETDGIMRITEPDKNVNICIQAEDFKTGDTLLAKGIRITPSVVGILASVGYTDVSVYKKPRISIIATGSEIVEPHTKPDPGQIRNSNSYQLTAQAMLCGADPVYMGIAGDTREQINDLFTRAVSTSDIVILSGGVSMGDFDFVPDILESNNVNIKFKKIAVKPGKPTVFGIKENTYIFGLPGNPVSTLVIFELLVKPLISNLSGYDYTPLYIKGELTQDIRTKKSKRQKFIPVQIESGRITPVSYHGSAHLLAYTQANGIICLSETGETYSKGDIVDVRQI